MYTVIHTVIPLRKFFTSGKKATKKLKCYTGKHLFHAKGVNKGGTNKNDYRHRENNNKMAYVNSTTSIIYIKCK